MARTLVGLVTGAITGGLLGLEGYNIFGSQTELLGDLIAAFEGGVVGAMTVGALGCWWPEWRAASSWSRLWATLGWLLCGVLLVTGTIYIGGWTDADGPNTEATIGILCIPASLAGMWGIPKYLRWR